MTRFETIDAHVAGAPVRLVTSGFPAPRGRTMLDKQAWAERHADAIRRTLMLEPRGHADMCGAVLTEPTEPGSHAGILFMHAGGFATMCGHAIAAVAVIARARGLLTTREEQGRFVFDTPAGTVRALAASAGSGACEHPAERIKVSHVPSFVLRAGVDLDAGGRRLRADVAYAGGFYAIVDAESAGVPIDGAHVDGLRRVARDIRVALARGPGMAHPIEPRIAGLHGTIFTAPPQSSGADLRTAAVFGDDAVDRSPGGDAVAAVLAVLDAMGFVETGQPLTFEGLAGQRLTVRLGARVSVGGYEAVVPEIEAEAWITGEHTFVVHDGDPLALGFTLGRRETRA
ncbi:MAG: proline racemase family protein [Vicinamibacterales bacterium]